MTGRAHIDRLEVRVRGSSPRSARALAAELGGALRPALEAELQRRPAGSERVARVSAAPVRVSRDTPPGRTAAAVARSVADALAGSERRAAP